MASKGFSHIGLSTLDLDRTRDFYENVLGFKAVRCDVLRVKEGGERERARREFRGGGWPTRTRPPRGGGRGAGGGGGGGGAAPQPPPHTAGSPGRAAPPAATASGSGVSGGS